MARFIYPSALGCLGSFHFSSTLDSTALKICVQTFDNHFEFAWVSDWNWSCQACCNCLFNSLRMYQSVPHDDCAKKKNFEIGLVM